MQQPDWCKHDWNRISASIEGQVDPFGNHRNSSKENTEDAKATRPSYFSPLAERNTMTKRREHAPRITSQVIAPDAKPIEDENR